MRCAYLSTDEVNQALAVAMAVECGVTLYALAPRDGPPDGSYDVVVCDWDSWPAQGRRDFLARLPFGSPTRCAVVHGYYLTDEEAATLIQNGVLVHRVLQPELFQSLVPEGSLSDF
jgi:hypothetical protein